VTQKKRMNQTKLADTLYSKIIRAKGYCAGAGVRFDCSQSLQCAHVVSRTYRAVRWRTDDPPGAVPLCGAHHVWWTHHPLEWITFMGQHYDTIRDLALTLPPENAGDALARLRTLAAEMEEV
jgi:hypothetical protein